MAETGTITVKQMCVIEHLVSGLSIVAAARAAGVGERTVHNWLKLPHFHQSLQQAQRRVHSYRMMRLLGMVDRALNTLDRNMDAKSPLVQVQAASKVLDSAHEQITVLQLEEEIAHLQDELKRYQQ